MKKLLPKGFTLIELLVVVAIIAILTVIAISLYSGIQKKARDSRRQAEIDSLQKSMEAVKNPTDSTYTYDAAFYDRDFPPAAAKPKDPTPGINYCFQKKTILSASPAVPPSPSPTWTSGCAGGWDPIPSTSQPILDKATSWTICAQLETDPTKVFCKTSLTN